MTSRLGVVCWRRWRGRIVGVGVVEGGRLGSDVFVGVVVVGGPFAFRGDRGCSVIGSVLRGVVGDLVVMHFLRGNVFLRISLRVRPRRLMMENRPWVEEFYVETTCDLVVVA